MSICIRPAAPSDASVACEVLRRSILECCVQDHQHRPAILDAWLGNKTESTVAGWFSANGNCSLVAERDGVVVGVALLTQAGKLSLCHVLPEALYCGAGKALLKGAEEQARQWGVSVLRLHSTATARAFFARHGYIHAGQEKSCYGVECDFFWKKLNADPNHSGESRQRYCGCATQ